MRRKKSGRCGSERHFSFISPSSWSSCRHHGLARPLTLTLTLTAAIPSRVPHSERRLLSLSLRLLLRRNTVMIMSGGIIGKQKILRVKLRLRLRLMRQLLLRLMMLRRVRISCIHSHSHSRPNLSSSISTPPSSVLFIPLSLL